MHAFKDKLSLIFNIASSNMDELHM